MKRCLLTLVAAAISFACGLGAARHTRFAGVGTTEPKGKPAAATVVTPADVTRAADPRGDVPASRDSFVMHLRLLHKPVDEAAFYEWARTAPLGELEEVIAALGHSPEPSREIRHLVATLAARDPGAALRRFGEWSEFGRFRLIEGLVAGWARQDPMAALEWVSTQRANAATDEAREAVMRRWAATDAPSALAAFRERGWQADSPKSLQSIFLTWVRRDPQAALTEWRALRQELNPPASPGAETPLDPFTLDLVAGLVGHPSAASNGDPVTAAFGWFAPNEWTQIPAGFWSPILASSDPEKILPKLEERLEFSKMIEVVGLAMRGAPEKGQAIMQSLKNPELREASAEFRPAARPRPSIVPAGDGADFWEKSITLDP